MVKIHIFTFSLLLFMAGLIHASSDDWIHGTVTDESGNPIEGVDVKFLNSPAKTVTDSEGKYSFDSTVAVKYERVEIFGHQPAITNNVIRFTVTESRIPVRLEIFNLNGQSVRLIHSGVLPAAEYRINLSEKLSPATYLVRLEMIGEVFSQRFVIDGSCTAGTGTAFSNMTSDQLAKKSASSFIDELQCEKLGYVSKNTGISSYKGKVDVTLMEEDTSGPVITFDEGTDTVQEHYSNTTAINSWMQSDNFHLTITDNKDTSFEMFPPTNTTIDYTKPGFADIVYNVRDRDWNIGEAIRLIVLYDSTVTGDTDPPVFTWDQDTVHLVYGTKWNPKEGVTVTDEVDSMVNFNPWYRITDNIETSYARDADGIICDVVGTYTVTYRVIDTSLNEAIVTRTVIVE